MGRTNHAVTRMARTAVPAALAAAAIAVAGCSNEGSQQTANVVNGKQQFVAKCGSCHTLARAGTKGIVGPNLDDAFAVSRSEGWGDDAIRGVVLGQIQHPGKGFAMPANLVKGDDADDVAAYVAASAAVPGKEGPILAAAVKSASSSKPAVAKAGVLTIQTDPTGQLAYVETTAQAAAGPINLVMVNKSSVAHDINIEGTSVKTPIATNATSSGSGTLKAGTYTYFCSLPGHRAAGMVGKLTVK